MVDATQIPEDIPCPTLPDAVPGVDAERWTCPDCSKVFVAAPVAAATAEDPYNTELVWVWEHYLAFMPDVTRPTGEEHFRLVASFYQAGDPKVTVINFAQDPAILIRPAEDQGDNEIALHLEAAGGLSPEMVAEMLQRCAAVLLSGAPDSTEVTERG